MKEYIRTCIEGVAGFCFFENRKNDSYGNFHHRQRMYRLLTAEVNGAARASFDCRAAEVIVNDSYDSGYNIIFEKDAFMKYKKAMPWAAFDLKQPSRFIFS